MELDNVDLWDIIKEFDDDCYRRYRSSNDVYGLLSYELLTDLEENTEENEFDGLNGFLFGLQGSTSTNYAFKYKHRQPIPLPDWYAMAPKWVHPERYEYHCDIGEGEDNT